MLSPSSWSASSQRSGIAIGFRQRAAPPCIAWAAAAAAIVRESNPRTRENHTGIPERRTVTRTLRSAGITSTATSEESTGSPLIVCRSVYSYARLRASGGATSSGRSSQALPPARAPESAIFCASALQAKPAARSTASAPMPRITTREMATITSAAPCSLPQTSQPRAFIVRLPLRYRRWPSRSPQEDRRGGACRPRRGSSRRCGSPTSTPKPARWAAAEPEARRDPGCTG